MSYEMFQSTIRGLVDRCGGGISVRFTHEDGKYTAHVSDGTRITGNPLSTRISVRWGNRNHLAQVEI